MKAMMTPLTEEQRLMVEENINLAYKMAWDLYKRCRVFPIEDVKQICCMGLCRAVKNYDPSLGTTLSTLAYISMKNLFFQEVRNKRQPEMISLDQPCASEEEESMMDFLMSELCAENVIGEDALCLSMDFDAYLSRENPMRQQVMRLSLAGLNCREVAEEVGCTRQNVDRIKAAVIRGFSKWMKGKK